jgi:hypothetical protein
MRHLLLLQACMQATPEPNLGASCQQRDAPASQQLREHAGRKSIRRELFQLRSPSGRCQPRLGAKSQRLNGRGGRRSSAGRKLRNERPFSERTYQRIGNRPPGGATLSALYLSAYSAWTYFNLPLICALFPVALRCVRKSGHLEARLPPLASHGRHGLQHSALDVKVVGAKTDCVF